jgi:hypothetical protein
MIIIIYVENPQVSVENLVAKQTGQEVEVRGPPVSKAFDQEGNPTKVSLWFRFFLLHPELWFENAALI